MTDNERLKASIYQIYTYRGSQYLEWRIAAVKSINKILENLDVFYEDIELEAPDEKRDLVHYQIRNGWFYEAVSQAEQAIEDLFSTIMNLTDLNYFAKKVIRYSAAEVKRYIWNFKVDSLEYICKEFRYPYFDLDEPWENEDGYEKYKAGVLLTQEYLRELQAFHKRYYLDYCQYKHGLSVALNPAQNPLMKDDEERRKLILEYPLKGGLKTFHQGTVDQYENRTGNLPAMGMLVNPEMLPHVRELLDEGNLLFYTMQVVDLEELERITEHACILLNTLWQNIIWWCEGDDTFHRVAFPMKELHRVQEIGFLKDE